MKMIKNGLLTLALISITTNITPRGDGGAWAGGTAIGLGTGLLIGSQLNKGSENPERTNIKSIDKDIRYEQREIKAANRDFRKGKIDREELNRAIAQHEENIKALRRQRAIVTA